MIANIFIRWMKSFIHILEHRNYARIFNIFVAMMVVSVLLFIALSSFFLVKYGPIMMNLAKKEYVIEKTAIASVDRPVPVSALIKTVEFGNDIEYSIPIKTTIRLPINQTFSLKLDKPVPVPIDHVLHMQENVHVSAQIPFDTTVTTSILGIKKTLPVKGVMPLNTVLPLKHDFHIKETVIIKMDEPISIPINDTFEIPVDIVMKGTLPREVVESTMPKGATIRADVTLEKKMPVTVKFNPFYTPEEYSQLIPRKQTDTP